MNDKEKEIITYRLIIDDMLELLRHNPDDGLRWNSTKQDLMLAVHVVYESLEVRDEYDVPVPYKILVMRACMILHEKVPKNPSAYVKQGEQCQGMRRQKLLLRYSSDYIQHYIV